MKQTASYIAGLIGLLLCIAMPFNGLANPSPQPISAFLNGGFSSTSPGTGGTWSQRNYFPEVTFSEPVRIIEHPTQNKLLILSKNGFGHLITNTEGATDKTEYFDITSIMHGVPGYGEGGVSDFAFHPEFGTDTENSAYVYITFRHSPDYNNTLSNTNYNGYHKLSRFSIVDNYVDLSTEQVLISQYDRDPAHASQNMEFGPDGYLYISLGDETWGCCGITDSATASTQKLDGGLWSGVLRIDVDKNPDTSHPIRRQPTHPLVLPQANGSHWPDSYTQNYYIPNDNPFVDPTGSTLEEYYAYGFRNPWSLSFDAVSGELWLADVGAREQEEVNLIVKGGNYQWPFKEGTAEGPNPEIKLETGIEVEPVWSYGRDVGHAVIGAGVYRGPLYPELYGKYLFSDHISGDFWMMEQTNGSYSPEIVGSISGAPGGITDHAFDRTGQILMARTAGPHNPNGTIEIFDRTNRGDSEPPTLLSDLAAFTSFTPMTPINGCIPYDLNVPFWSDGAAKSRWVCIPNDGTHDTPQEQINYSDEGIWGFPVGTVFIKHFEMATDTSTTANTFPLETRFLVHAEDGYYGVTYRWNENGTDATLETGQSSTTTFTQTTANGTTNRTWEYPSRTECMVCHNRQAGSVLGANTRQLNRNYTNPHNGHTGNQLETYNSLGMLSPAINTATTIPNVLTSTPTGDISAPIEDRARSYLDSNCSYCHQPNGAPSNFDARLTTPLTDQGLINGTLLADNAQPGEAVVVAGSTTRSVLFHRANIIGDTAMPPLSKTLTDTEGVAVLEEWIQSLDPTLDTDGDGFVDSDDPFPLDPYDDQDRDNISGHIDNCPTTSNTNQTDTDNDGLGDACDPTSDPEPEFIAQIQSVQSGKCIEITLASQDNGANANSGPCELTAAHQRLYFVPVPSQNNTYTLELEHSGQCLTVTGGAAENDASLIQQTCDNSNAQQFRIEDTGANKVIYTSTGLPTGAIDSRNSPTDIVQWEFHGGDNQRWVYFSSESYTPLPKDTTEPTASIVSLAPNQAIQSNHTFSGTATDSGGSELQSVSITIMDLSNKQYLDSNGTYTTDWTTIPTTLAANGEWSASINYPTSVNGDFRLMVIPVDGNNNTPSNATNTTTYFSIDNEAPAVTVNNIDSNLLTPGPITLSGTSTDNGTIALTTLLLKNNTTGEYWNGTNWIPTLTTLELDNPDSWSLTVTLPKGNFTVVANSWDSANNLGKGYKNISIGCEYVTTGTTNPNTSGTPTVIKEATGTVISANFFDSGAIDPPYYDGQEFVSVCVEPADANGQVTTTITTDVGLDDDTRIKGYPQFIVGSKFGNQYETSYRYYQNTGLSPEHQWPVKSTFLDPYDRPYEFANLEYVSKVKGVGLPAFTNDLPEIKITLDIDENNIIGAERDVMLESWFHDTAANANILGNNAAAGLPIANTLNNIVGVGHRHYPQLKNTLLEMMVHVGALSPNDVSESNRNPGQNQLTENYSGKDYDNDGIDDHFDVDSHQYKNSNDPTHPSPGLYTSGIDANADGIDDADILPVKIGDYTYSIWWGETYRTPVVIFSRETNANLQPAMDLSSEGEIELPWTEFVQYTLTQMEDQLKLVDVPWVTNIENPNNPDLANHKFYNPFPKMRAAGGAIGGVELGIEPQTNNPADKAYTATINKFAVEIDGRSFGLTDISPPKIIINPMSFDQLTEGLTTISGTATDVAAITKVELQLKNTSTNQYWNGSTWVSTQARFEPNGTNNWSYELTLPVGNFEVKSWAWDSANNSAASPITSFVINSTTIPSTCPSSLEFGHIGKGVAAIDSATGIGWIMWSKQNVMSRFSPSPHPSNATHLIAVTHRGNQWFYDNNFVLTPFSPAPDDCIIAEVDFTADTVNLSPGHSTAIYGIDTDFQNHNIVFTPNQWDGNSNNGEFGINIDSENIVSTCPASIDIGDTGKGIAARDSATGIGWIMWSKQNIMSRFSPSPHPSNATHLIAVTHRGNQWFYDNNSVLSPFTPASDDCILAELDFTDDTAIALDSTSTNIYGIDAGYQNGNLAITPNFWNGSSNTGEFGVTGTNVNNLLSTCPSTMDLGDNNRGVAARDSAHGTGWLLWSDQNVHSRFSPSPHPHNAEHLIAITYQNSHWLYDNNSVLTPFFPSPDDCIIAELDFSNNTASTLQGVSTTINGIDAGYLNGDLIITPGFWNASKNPGEFGIDGIVLLSNQ